jgi:Flp pilus assembly protein CpaB
MRAGKQPTDIEVSRDDILAVRCNPGDPDPASFLLIGKAFGSTTLTFVYPDNSKDTYTVFVEHDRKPFAKLLRSGFVAVTVALPCENAVGGHLGLNDYVIVYATKASGTEKKTTVLMKNVRVLSSPIGTEARCSLHLEVTSDEGKLLRNAMENGTIALALVAEADVKDEKALQDRKGESESPKTAAPKTPDTR